MGAVGNEWMSEDFTGSDPLSLTHFQHGLHELDTLLSLVSLSSVVPLQTHLVYGTKVKSTISQVIFMIHEKIVILTMKATLHLPFSDHPEIVSDRPSA